MLGTGDDFVCSNNESWRDAFALTVGADGAAPWRIGAGVPAWAPLTPYDAGSAAIAPNGDLVVARPGLSSTAWTSAATYDADADVSGLARWLVAGEAASYARMPLDLTGAEWVDFAVGLVDASGVGLDVQPVVMVSTRDAGGALRITNRAAGGLALNVPLVLTRQVPPGTYGYDYAVTWADGSRDRVRHGAWTVEQGIA